MPAVSSRSFTPYGMPCSGPRYLPAAISRSAARACREREVGRERDDRAELRVEPLDPLEIDVRQSLRRQLLRLDPARELRDGREGDVGVARRERHVGRRSSARIDRPSGDLRARVRRRPGVQVVAGASVSSSASLRGPVRRSNSAASDVRQLRDAISRCAGVIVTCISFSASANVAGETSGPTGGAVLNAGGAPGVAGVRRRAAGRGLLLRAATRGEGGGEAERGLDEELATGVHGDGDEGNAPSDGGGASRAMICGAASPAPQMSLSRHSRQVGPRFRHQALVRHVG